MIKTVAEKIDSPGIHLKYLPVVFDGQPEFAEFRLDRVEHPVQCPLIRPEKDHIVHVAGIIPSMKLFSDQMINALKIEICEPLRRDIADREAGRTVYDHVQQMQEPLIFQNPA